MIHHHQIQESKQEEKSPQPSNQNVNGPSGLKPLQKKQRTYGKGHTRLEAFFHHWFWKEKAQFPMLLLGKPHMCFPTGVPFTRRFKPSRASENTKGRKSRVSHRKSFWLKILIKLSLPCRNDAPTKKKDKINKRNNRKI